MHTGNDTSSWRPQRNGLPHWFCATCTPMTCQLHVAENSFTLTTYVSPFKANTSANWNAVSRQIWRECHTSVDSGDLSQAPPKQSAVCSTCIIPTPPTNCQWPHNPATGFRPPSATVVSAEPFSHGTGTLRACRRKWRLTDTDLCPCGKTQMMSHIVESCPLTKLNGGLSRLHSADEDALFRGWPVMVHDTHTRRRRRLEEICRKLRR